MDTVMIAPSRGEEVEVLAKAKRRRFTLEYKSRILRCGSVLISVSTRPPARSAWP